MFAGCEAATSFAEGLAVGCGIFREDGERKRRNDMGSPEADANSVGDFFATLELPRFSRNDD